ncbi:MAG: zinc ribbon domain-containing protein [bacterium]|nr:zinc ribbon domain-containing protein [bacterium]
MGRERKKQCFIYCPNCEFRGKAEQVRSGFKVFLEVVLFFCLIIPWVIYKRFYPQKLQCPKCGNTRVNRLASYYTKECPYCQKKVTSRDPICPQCGRTLSAMERYGRMRATYTKQTRWK